MPGGIGTLNITQPRVAGRPQLLWRRYQNFQNYGGNHITEHFRLCGSTLRLDLMKRVPQKQNGCGTDLSRKHDEIRRQSLPTPMWRTRGVPGRGPGSRTLSSRCKGYKLLGFCMYESFQLWSSNSKQENMAVTIVHETNLTLKLKLKRTWVVVQGMSTITI